MVCKEGQFDVVELMENDQLGYYYQFECSKCEWNDSFCINELISSKNETF